MRNKLNQFIDNLNGQFIEVSDKNNIFQCMDLAYLWVFCLDFPKATIQNKYAFNVFKSPKDITKQYFEIIPNTPDFIPEDGDIVVFEGGLAGHIGIALSGGSTTSFLYFSQNLPLGTNAHIEESDYNSPKLLGALRPKVSLEQQTSDIISDDNARIDLSTLDHNTDLDEVYGVLKLQVIKSKLTAKDRAIKLLQAGAISEEDTSLPSTEENPSENQPSEAVGTENALFGLIPQLFRRIIEFFSNLLG